MVLLTAFLAALLLFQSVSSSQIIGLEFDPKLSSDKSNQNLVPILSAPGKYLVRVLTSIDSQCKEMGMTFIALNY